MRRTLVRRRSRAAFTLIELLVVIAIIGVLVALILPAVQGARESANRIKCVNNLKQLGLAAQEYHDAFSSFPSGWYCNETDTTNCLPYSATPAMWNGMVSLFQKLEQGNLYDELNLYVPPAYLDANNVMRPYPDNATSVRRSLEFLVCPSNRKAAATATPSGTSPTNSTGPITRIGPSDYRGNMAAGLLPNCVDPNPINCAIFDNGITFRNSEVSIADITDGTSFTILYGEALQGNWPEATSCCVRTTLDRTINKPLPGTTLMTYWSSKHNGVVNFAKCDGSVASINSTIKKPVLLKLMTRNGGEAVSSDEIK